MPTLFYLDQHREQIENGGGIDADMQRLFRDHPELTLQMASARQMALQHLDQTRAYQLSKEVVELCVATAQRLEQVDIRLPVPNCWIEFEGVAIGDDTLRVRAVWQAPTPIGTLISLIENDRRSKALSRRRDETDWWFEQGSCPVNCVYPKNDRHPIAEWDDTLSIRLGDFWDDCRCAQAGNLWGMLMTAIGMALRAEGIEQEIIQRPQQKRRSARGISPHAPVFVKQQITRLHLAKKIVYVRDDLAETPETIVTEVNGRPIQVASFLRHLDPQRNPRWKEEKVVIVKGHQRVIRGVPHRYLVDL